MKKHDFILELMKQRATARMLWEKCPTTDGSLLFFHQSHTIRYEVLTKMVEFVKQISDADFAKTWDKVENEHERPVGQIPIWWDKELTEHFT